MSAIRNVRAASFPRRESLAVPGTTPNGTPPKSDECRSCDQYEKGRAGRQPFSCPGVVGRGGRCQGQVRRMAARGQTFLRLLGNGAKAWPTDEFVWRLLSWSQIWSHLGSFAAVHHGSPRRRHDLSPAGRTVLDDHEQVASD